jgi:transposase
LEDLSRRGLIDLFFGDESHFCSEGYVPRGWQFAAEEVSIDVEKGFKTNCIGLINRACKCVWKTTKTNIDSLFVVNFLDDFANKLVKETVVVFDNATIHKSKKIKAKIEEWQEKGLYIFYLPPYSPELNIAETLWRILKGLEIRPQDYKTEQSLDDRLTNRLENIGSKWTIQFAEFNHN